MADPYYNINTQPTQSALQYMTPVAQMRYGQSAGNMSAFTGAPTFDGISNATIDNLVKNYNWSTPTTSTTTQLSTEDLLKRIRGEEVALGMTGAELGSLGMQGLGLVSSYSAQKAAEKIEKAKLDEMRKNREMAAAEMGYDPTTKTSRRGRVSGDVGSAFYV